MLVNIMVFKLVLIKACFEPLSYNFFSDYRPIVKKKPWNSKFSYLCNKQFIIIDIDKKHLYETI